MQGQICDILRPLWPHRFPHFGYIHLGGGGSDIRSMSSIRPICKCRYPTLQQEVMAVAGRSSELACSAEVDPRLADRSRISWARENVLVGLGNQSLLSDTGSHPLRYSCVESIFLNYQINN